MVAMLGKTLYYLELHLALFSLAISTNHRLRRNPLASAGQPPSLQLVATCGAKSPSLLYHSSYAYLRYLAYSNKLYL
jgi:hypothetical protein